MHDAFTPAAQRALDRAKARARARGVSAVEPIDLLAALADEAENRAAELMTRFGASPERVLESLGLEVTDRMVDPESDSVEAGPGSAEAMDATIAHSPAFRAVLGSAVVHARALDRGEHVGTEHLLAGLIAETLPALDRLVAAGLDLEQLRGHLAEGIEAQFTPLAPLEEIPPLDLSDPTRAVDLGRILDASANRAREGLRVVEDYTRFVLDDSGLTRRLKEVRHRLAEALKGFDPDLLVGARDTREDVGTHIMTHTEQVRENPRAVLAANFKRTQEALRTLEEYGKLVDVWLAGRFEVLRYDVYTLEKLVMTAVHAYRALGDARLMVLVGGLRTMGDLTWIVGEVLAGGADIIQLREKGLPDRELLTRAREVRILTAQARARFLLNDRPDLARLAGADGVHLGQEDMTVRDARRIVGPNLLIGVSTHHRAQLDAAVLSGAGYLGVGPVFPSATKEFSEPELAGLAYIQAAAETTNIPWFAIGGITEENVSRVLEAGATRIAVSAAVVKADRPRKAAERLKARLEGREIGERGAFDMIILANIQSALEQLWAHRLRSLLTVLGIVIAVTSTITVVGVIQGFTRYVAEFLQGLGTNAMWVWPERPAGEAGKRLGRIELDERDIAAIEQGCPGIRRVSALVKPPDVLLQYGRDELKVPIEGGSAEYHAIRNFPVESGRPFSVVDVEQGHHVCILGQEVLRKLNLDDGIVGQPVLLAGRRFRVIGILEEKGSFLGNSQDNIVLVPYTMALKMYPVFRRKLAVTAQAVSEKAVPEARAQIVNLLRRRHRLDAYQPNDFNIMTQDEILEAFNNLSMVATAVLAGIVGISLLVGGIGIMNVMLVSVTERTREIGLRKAVGARRRDIMLQFLTEAVCLSAVGGCLGIALGYGLCALVSLHPQMVDVIVPWWAVALGFGISATTGVIFGLVPAVKAALLNPIDALRHE